MKDQLIRYVDLLFAGAPQATEIKQEILQNTLDRYDDLIAQGKSPQAAYQLAISGIGDINEILGSISEDTPTECLPQSVPGATPFWKKFVRAIGICLYIICPIPLFVLSELGMGTIGLCGTLSIVAVATTLMVIAGGKESQRKQATKPKEKPEAELSKAINSAIWAIGLCVYFILSFTTQAWYITWVIFPMIAAVQGLIKACMDLKEANPHES